MQTRLTPTLRNTALGQEAEAILRKCVHCGFCTATCPTYQVLGDELDGPRGRIYLIKQFLEGQPVSAITRDHLDRCLGCRSCETTCPSGVQYHRLLDIARERLERAAPRPLRQRLLRRALRAVIPHRGRFTALLRIGQTLRPLLPLGLARRVPVRRHAGPVTATGDAGARRMLLLGGCVQPGLAPNIDAAATRLLGRLGITLQAAPGAGCCGAVSHHLAAGAEALAQMRRNIDVWHPLLEAGAEALVVSASGCASMVKDYAALLAHDPAYAERAARVAAATRDLAEVVADADLSPFNPTPGRRIAFHSPCSLQHGQRLGGVVEAVLRRAGFELAPVADGHLCCGSAGTYSLLQPTLAKRLREDKLAALTAGGPELVATANIGCLEHLGATCDRPLLHWVELFDPALTAPTLEATSTARISQ